MCRGACSRRPHRRSARRAFDRRRAGDGAHAQLLMDARGCGADQDRKSTRLNSSHSQISYAVFCLKKKNTYRSRSTDMCLWTSEDTPSSLPPLMSFQSHARLKNPRKLSNAPPGSFSDIDRELKPVF